jgi:hypothetical protein|tara:strand:+ start:3921 stop:4073 length:153 start_codon:yes stop_codon:yes gene_type:complete
MCKSDNVRNFLEVQGAKKMQAYRFYKDVMRVLGLKPIQRVTSIAIGSRLQ